MATKQFSLKISDDVFNEFENINSELGSSTKGETFRILLEKYRKPYGSPEEYQQEIRRITEEIQQEYQRKTEEIQEEYQRKTEEYQRKTEEIQEEYQQITEENQQEYQRKTEEIQKENQRLSLENQRYSEENQKRHKVSPKWLEIGNECAKLNGYKNVDELHWVIFTSWTHYNIEHGVKRLPDKVIEEIKTKYKN